MCVYFPKCDTNICNSVYVGSECWFYILVLSIRDAQVHQPAIADHCASREQPGDGLRRQFRSGAFHPVGERPPAAGAEHQAGAAAQWSPGDQQRFGG